MISAIAIRPPLVCLAASRRFLASSNRTRRRRESTAAEMVFWDSFAILGFRTDQRAEVSRLSRSGRSPFRESASSGDAKSAREFSVRQRPDMAWCNQPSFSERQIFAALEKQWESKQVKCVCR
jgi:hypothetical protein